jgi:hypothetical protein
LPSPFNYGSPQDEQDGAQAQTTDVNDNNENKKQEISNNDDDNNKKWGILVAGVGAAILLVLLVMLVVAIKAWRGKQTLTLKEAAGEKTTSRTAAAAAIAHRAVDPTETDREGDVSEHPDIEDIEHIEGIEDIDDNESTYAEIFIDSDNASETSSM